MVIHPYFEMLSKAVSYVEFQPIFIFVAAALAVVNA
jgi:hypothetical protein